MERMTRDQVYAISTDQPWWSDSHRGILSQISRGEYSGYTSRAGSIAYRDLLQQGFIREGADSKAELTADGKALAYVLFW